MPSDEQPGKSLLSVGINRPSSEAFTTEELAPLAERFLVIPTGEIEHDAGSRVVVLSLSIELRRAAFDAIAAELVKNLIWSRIRRERPEHRPEAIRFTVRGSAGTMSLFLPTTHPETTSEALAAFQALVEERADHESGEWYLYDVKRGICLPQRSGRLEH